MRVTLERFAYTPTETQGVISVGPWRAYSIEQKWDPWERPGGRPFSSCIPDGVYTLEPHRRPDGLKTFAMVNHELGVRFHGTAGDPFRFLCVIHPANFASDVEGCIGIGDQRVMAEGRIMVTRSQRTTRELFELLPWERGHVLEIKPAIGARDELD